MALPSVRAAAGRMQRYSKYKTTHSSVTASGSRKTAYHVQKSGDNSSKTIGNEEKACTWCRKRKMRSQRHTWNGCRKLKATMPSKGREGSAGLSAD